MALATAGATFNIQAGDRIQLSAAEDSKGSRVLCLHKLPPLPPGLTEISLPPVVAEPRMALKMPMNAPSAQLPSRKASRDPRLIGQPSTGAASRHSEQHATAAVEDNPEQLQGMDGRVESANLQLRPPVPSSQLLNGTPEQSGTRMVPIL